MAMMDVIQPPVAYVVPRADAPRTAKPQICMEEKGGAVKDRPCIESSVKVCLRIYDLRVCDGSHAQHMHFSSCHILHKD